jgi:hypothetical protein
MKTSLLELDQLGLLASASLPKELDWLEEADKQLLVDIHLAGEFGLSKAVIAKFEKKHPDSQRRLYANSFVDWLTDSRGRPASLVLTGRGEDAAELLMRIARNQSKPTVTKHMSDTSS